MSLKYQAYLIFFVYNLIHQAKVATPIIAHGTLMYRGVVSSCKLPQSGRNLMDIRVSIAIVK
jgi:hypothetical protein